MLEFGVAWSCSDDIEVISCWDLMVAGSHAMAKGQHFLARFVLQLWHPFFSSSGMFLRCWWGKGFYRCMVWAPIVTYFQHFNQFWISALTDAHWKSGEQLVLWEKNHKYFEGSLATWPFSAATTVDSRDLCTWSHWRPHCSFPSYCRTRPDKLRITAFLVLNWRPKSA